jgi:hypothetical protein
MKYTVLTAAILFAAVLLNACKQQHTSTAKPAIHKIRGEVIAYPCAVIILPTNGKIAKMKKEYGANYDTIIDDDTYYLSESGQFLDSVKLKQINKYATGNLTFKTPGGKLFTLNLAKYTFAVVLFNGKTKPVEADMAMIESTYNSYMK